VSWWDDITDAFTGGSRVTNYKEGPVSPLTKFDFRCSCGKKPVLSLQARNALFLEVQCECGKGQVVSVAD
jgi:hypothetical protein